MYIGYSFTHLYNFTFSLCEYISNFFLIYPISVFFRKYFAFSIKYLKTGKKVHFQGNDQNTLHLDQFPGIESKCKVFLSFPWK